jgi:hypothetical protein
MVSVHRTTNLGDWLKQHSLDLEWLCNKTNLPHTRLLPLLNDPEYKPDGTTMRIILSRLKEIDTNTKLSDFWDV